MNNNKRKKVCLIPALYFKSFQEYTEGRIPFECLNLTGVIEKNDFDCSIVDFNIKSENKQVNMGNISFPKLNIDKNFYEKAAKELEKENADVYVFLVTIHTTGNYFHSLEMSKKLKKLLPNIVIIFGGLGAASTDIETLREYKNINFIMRGENEVILDKYLKCIKANKDYKNIDGITYISDNNEVIQNNDIELIKDLDTIPFSKYEFYRKPIEILTGYTCYIDNILLEENIHIEAGRGCYYKCKFCSNPKLWKNAVRFKSVDRLINEIEFCINNYHAKNFCFHSQLFTANKNYVIEFCKRIKEKGFDIKWSCFTRTEFIDDEILKALSGSGCKTILFGIESASQKILNDINKKAIIENEIKKIKKVMMYNIEPQLSFIIGFPTESKEDLENTINLYFKYKFMKKVDSQIGLLAPVGYSQLLEEYKDKLEFDGIGTTTWNTRFFSKESIKKIVQNKEIFPQNCYFNFDNIDRKKYVFIKMFDIATSYLKNTIKNIIVTKGISLTNELYEEYKKWNGKINFSWNCELDTIIKEIYNFLKECIVPKMDDGEIIKELIDYEYNYSIINNVAKKRFYNYYCNKIVLSENSQKEEKNNIDFYLNYDINDIRLYIEKNINIRKRNCHYRLEIIDSNHIKVIKFDNNNEIISEKIEVVFNHVEY